MGSEAFGICVPGFAAQRSGARAGRCEAGLVYDLAAYNPRVGGPCV